MIKSNLLVRNPTNGFPLLTVFICYLHIEGLGGPVRIFSKFNLHPLIFASKITYSFYSIGKMIISFFNFQPATAFEDKEAVIFRQDFSDYGEIRKLPAEA